MSHAASGWPRLVVVTDLRAAPAERWLERIDALAVAARPGALAVLLREHQLAGGERLAFGRTLRALTRGRAQQLWVADRLDLALLLEAEGLHLGEASVRAVELGRHWSRRVSRAWHQPGVGAADASELEGVGAVLASPIVAPRKARAALGYTALTVLGEQLRARHSASPLQIYALGGVTASTAPACQAAGAWGVAVIGAALSDDPAALVAALGAAA